MRAALRAVAGLSAAAVGLVVVGPTAAADPLTLPDDVQLGVVKSLDVGPAGRLVMANTMTSGVEVLELRPTGRGWDSTVMATLPAGTATAAAQHGRGQTSVLYGLDFLGGGQGPSLWSVSPSGRFHEVLDIEAYQHDDPDPFDLEGHPTESNPFDVEVMGDGSALVADAAANDLLRVWPDGSAVTVACFPTEMVATDHLPFPFPAPQIPAEAVPTGVSLGPDQMAYVSELKGFPSRPGTSKVWRVDPDGVRQGCEAGGTPGQVVASGLTSLVDVSVTHDGSLLVTELDVNGWLAAEGVGTPGGGRILRIDDGTPTVVADGLLFPGAAVEGKDGAVYAVNMFLMGAQLLRLS